MSRKVKREDRSRVVPLDLDPPVVVTGDGSSLWMARRGEGESSAGEHKVTKALLEYLDFMEEDDEGSWSLEVYGPEINWACYTDHRIEEEILEKLRPLYEKLGYRIKSLGWSEQGLQPDGGWNFDCEVEELKYEDG